MNVQCVNPDRISNLPQDITGYMLTCMPIRDAIRTSILSRNWRCGWKSMTKLVFDDKMVKDPSNCRQLKKYKLASAILNVLSLHTGSLLDIKIDVGDLDVGSEFDQIIRSLSRNNHLQKMCFEGSFGPCYKLPSSLFSLQGLENGFSKLSVVCFRNVDIPSQTLQLFLSNCPELRELSLIADHSREFVKGNKLTFVELLQCLPLIEFLHISGAYMEYFSAGGMPYKLTTSLVQLKSLWLDVCFDEEDILSAALCLIRSSPNLKELSLLTYYKSKVLKNFPGIRDYSGFTLDHLENLEILCFADEDFQVGFLKLIMANSPMLKEVYIQLHKDVSLEEENKIRRDSLQLPSRASPSLKLIIEEL